MTTTASSEQLVSREELIARARELAPLLRQRSLRTEQERRVSSETVAVLIASGLMRVGNPVRFGGLGHDYDAVLDVTMELGKACGATAWCYAVWQSHNWMIGNFPLQTQEDYYSGGPDTIASTAVSVVQASAVQVDDGYRLSGRWNLSSGCDSAQWFLLAAQSQAAPPQRLMMLVPAEQVQIIDNWHVSGLRGTGSKDVSVEDVFVPAHRAGSLAHHFGWELHRRASYRLPLMNIWPYTLASPVVGMAQGALDEFTKSLTGKTGPGRTAESVALQLRLAESASEVDAARLILRSDCKEMLGKAERDEEFSDVEQTRYRRNQAYVTLTCVRAIDRLFAASGGHSLYDEKPMQRFQRDATAAAHHSALYWDSSAAAFGRALLGLPQLGGGFSG